MFSKLFKRSRSSDPAFNERKLAFSNGIDISENPYQNSDKGLASSWESGWKDTQKARKAFEKKHALLTPRAAGPANYNVPSYASIDTHVQRFIEISQALGEIGAIFESAGTLKTSGSETDTLEQAAQTVNKLRIPGFFAYHLAQEALSLLPIIAASAALAKKDAEASEKINAALSQIEKSEPMLRQTAYEMEPYKSMDAKEAIQLIAARIAERRGK